jgi:putative ABC transport system substrate-binding protein
MHVVEAFGAIKHMIRYLWRWLAAVALSAALASTGLWTQHAIADQSDERIVRIGFLGQGSQADMGGWLRAFRDQLKRLGYADNANLVIETRWANGDVNRLPALVKELAEGQVDLLVTAGTPGAVAARGATEKIPIVAIAMADPVRSGLIRSLGQPGGNLTGTSMGYGEELGGKWLELLQETVTHLSAVAVIANPDNAVLRHLTQDVQVAARKRGLRVHVIEIREASALDRAFKEARRSAQATVLLADAVALGNRRLVASLAISHRVPVIYTADVFVDEGGLMAYTPSIENQFRRAAEYVDKILKGMKPAELPVEQPTKFELALNLQAAKSIGVTFPESVLLRSDRVIR